MDTIGQVSPEYAFSREAERLAQAWERMKILAIACPHLSFSNQGLRSIAVQMYTECGLDKADLERLDNG